MHTEPPDRMIDQKTSIARERLILASIMSSPGAKLGPNVATALAYNTYWDLPEHASLARAIGLCIRNERPITDCSVSEYLPKKERNWSLNEAYRDGIPLGIAEVEAVDLLIRYRGKKMQAQLGQIYSELKSKPERARDLAAQLKAMLEEYL